MKTFSIRLAVIAFPVFFGLPSAATATVLPSTPTPTETATCAPTGTPYCRNVCPPPNTPAPGCYASGGDPCIQNPQCASNEVCVPSSNGYISGCCACATVTPTPPDTLTETPTLTPTPIPTSAPAVCVGDCNGDGEVTVNEIITMVGAILSGGPSPSTCPAIDQWCSGPGVTINCVVQAVNSALSGCPEGACLQSLDGACSALTSLGFPTHRSCCRFAAMTAIPGVILWCSAEDFDPATGQCRACAEPCVGIPCTSQSDCETGLLCVDGLCAVPNPTPTPTPTPPSGQCRSNVDCPVAQHPLPGLPEFCLEPGGFPGCGYPTVPVPTPNRCQTDSDCASFGTDWICAPPNPYSCEGGLTCTRGCASDSECSFAQACSEAHHCVPRPCVSDNDCPEFAACTQLSDSGARGCMRRTCAGDQDCLGGVCVNGRCFDQLGMCMVAPY